MYTMAVMVQLSTPEAADAANPVDAATSQAVKAQLRLRQMILAGE